MDLAGPLATATTAAPPALPALWHRERVQRCCHLTSSEECQCCCITASKAPMKSWQSIHYQQFLLPCRVLAAEGEIMHAGFFDRRPTAFVGAAIISAADLTEHGHGFMTVTVSNIAQRRISAAGRCMLYHGAESTRSECPAQTSAATASTINAAGSGTK